jgi:hypothetical protein
MSEAPAPAKSKKPLIIIIGAVVVGLCLCVAVAVAAYFLLRGRLGRAVQPTIEYILDASPRMNSTASGGDTRIGVARGVLTEIVRTADPGLTAGLRLFGAGAKPEACQDTNLVVPLALSNQGRIEEGLGGVAPGPQSDSALAEAMIAAIRDVAKTKGPHSIVVVTGGADSCNPESGQLIRQEADRAGVDLKMFVIGFDVPPEDAEAIRAMVAMIPGATYEDAPKASALRDILTGIQAEVNRQVTEVTTESPTTAAAESACDHPYFPLRTGSSWTYAMPDGTMTWSVGGASGSNDSAEATMEVALSDVSMAVHWSCSSAGIVSYDFGNLSVASLGEVASMEVVDSSGAWLPAPDLLVPGYSWPNSYTLVMHVSQEGFAADLTMTVSETSTATGIETITVPAGTFEALRVDGTESVSMSGFMGEAVNMTVDTTYWYAKGVGVVRYSSSGSEGTGSRGELTSYTVP